MWWLLWPVSWLGSELTDSSSSSISISISISISNVTAAAATAATSTSTTVFITMTVAMAIVTMVLTVVVTPVPRGCDHCEPALRLKQVRRRADECCGAKRVMLGAIRRQQRVNGKQPDPRAQLLPQPPVLPPEEPRAKRMVYLVTMPHPVSERSTDGVKLVAPETLSKQDVLDRILLAAERPHYASSVKDAASGSGVPLRRRCSR